MKQAEDFKTPAEYATYLAKRLRREQLVQAVHDHFCDDLGFKYTEIPRDNGLTRDYLKDDNTIRVDVNDEYDIEMWERINSMEVGELFRKLEERFGN